VPACGLAAIAVDAVGGHATAAEPLGETVGAVLGAREHQRVAHPGLAQELDQ
jgi:hypothetical protein